MELIRSAEVGALGETINNNKTGNQWNRMQFLQGLELELKNTNSIFRVIYELFLPLYTHC